jgi:hypothetical protein
MLHIWKLFLYNLCIITILPYFATVHHLQVINYCNRCALFWFEWKMFLLQPGKPNDFSSYAYAYLQTTEFILQEHGILSGKLPWNKSCR